MAAWDLNDPSEHRVHAGWRERPGRFLRFEKYYQFLLGGDVAYTMESYQTQAPFPHRALPPSSKTKWPELPASVHVPYDKQNQEKKFASLFPHRFKTNSRMRYY